MTDGTEKDDLEDLDVAPEAEAPEYEIDRFVHENSDDNATVTGFKEAPSAADLALEAEDAAIEADEKAALVRATSKAEGKPSAKDKVDTGMKPGFKLPGEEVSSTPASSSESTPNFNTRGHGWMYRKDAQGKTHRVRDDGNSIYIPGRPSLTQMQMVAELAQEKGWTNVFVFDRSGSKLHPEGTQTLKHIIGNACCSDPKEAGKLRHHLADAHETFYNTLKARHEAAHPKTPRPAAP